MDEREHEAFLIGIALKVGKLIVKPANLKCFRQQDRISWERDKLDLLLSSLPKDDITECTLPPQGPEYPIKEVLPAYYALLTILHDHYRVDDIKINNGIWSEDEERVYIILEEISWEYSKELVAGDRLRAYIELALDHVKADLPEKPANTGQENKGPLKTILHPTIKNIVEIIEKLKTLKEKLSDFINEKCNTSPDKADEMVHTIDDEVDGKLSAEQLLRSLLDFDSTSLKESRQNTPSEKLLKFVGMHPKELFENKLEELPIDELARLLNEVIPRLIADSKILSTKKQQLHQIKKSISRKLEREEKAKDRVAKIIETVNQCDLLRRQREGDWPEDIKQLINEIDMLLFPYKDYLKEKGSWGKSESGIIEMGIKSGRPVDLDDVIQELEKIKYKIEVESQQPTEARQETTPNNKSKAKKTKTPKKAEKKFQPWKKSGDACFIIEDNRIKFYYKQEAKDLRLRNETNPHKLLFLFAAKNPLPQSEIKNLCTEKTRPSDIAKQTNTKLNEKIVAMAFSDVTKDIEFVKYDDKSKCYALWPKIKHKDDVDL